MTAQPPRQIIETDAPDATARAWLSSLADGEARAVEPATEHWRDSADARRSWHAYHLIGDVLRSDELASAPQRDAAFMAGLRERLAQEPVVLAPVTAVSTAPAPADTPASWSLPAALVAGFVVVAGVLMVARLGPAEPGGAAAVPALEMAAASGAQAAGTEVRQTANGQLLIVDPRLNEFLRVHQAAGGHLAAPAPGGSLRQVDVVVQGAGGTR